MIPESERRELFRGVLVALRRQPEESLVERMPLFGGQMEKKKVIGEQLRRSFERLNAKDERRNRSTSRKHQ
jgi:hypothetical protein